MSKLTKKDVHYEVLDSGFDVENVRLSRLVEARNALKEQIDKTWSCYFDNKGKATKERALLCELLADVDQFLLGEKE